MIEILTQAAAQVPALVVLCLLVYIFVSSLKAERTAIETIASEALDRNTEAMAENQKIIQAAIDALNRTEKRRNGRRNGVGARFLNEMSPDPILFGTKCAVVCFSDGDGASMVESDCQNDRGVDAMAEVPAAALKAAQHQATRAAGQDRGRGTPISSFSTTPRPAA